MAAAGQEAGEEELGHEGDNNADFLFFFFLPRERRRRAVSWA